MTRGSAVDVHETQRGYTADAMAACAARGQANEAGNGGRPGQGELLQIGQMAHLNSVSEKALRIYQQKGILNHAVINRETGYRYYSLDQSATLDMVSQLHSLGFTLDQIAQITTSHDVADLRSRVEGRLEQIERRSSQLDLARQVAKDILRSCDLLLHKPPCGVLELQALPERHILCFDIEQPKHIDDVFTDGRAEITNWEWELRNVKRTIVERGWPISLFRNVGCIISHKDLMAEKIRYSGAFVDVSPAFGQEVFSQAQTVPAGTYLTEYVDSLYTDEGAERETVELSRMLGECRRRGLEPCGDYLGVVIADGPAFQFEGRQMLFKMCLPVRLSDQWPSGA